MTRHFARTTSFDHLWTGLTSALAEGLIREIVNDDGLVLYCYTEECNYNKRWDAFTLSSRGLIIDPKARKVVATPFPKFFNYQEHNEKHLPAGSFDIFDKLDGSLIILFHHGGKWKTATKGSFKSSQAVWAKKWLDTREDKILSNLDKETTYLLEAIYPENKIVVSYDYSGLVLLGAYNKDGYELSREHLCDIATKTYLKIAKSFSYNSVSQLLELAKELPVSSEGFVLQYHNGLRVKIKGEEYCRLHRLISRLTPLAIWEAMEKGDNLEELRKQLPEEFLVDFDKIHGILLQKLNTVLEEIKQASEECKDMSDKQLGLNLLTFPENIRSFLFPFRRLQGDLISHERSKTALFKTIRPDNNALEGYTPSYAMNRVLADV